MMTKAQDKALLAKTVAKLPEGYTRDILSDLLPEMERAIDNDFAYIPVAIRIQQNEEFQTSLRAERAKLEALKAEVRQLERTRDTLLTGIESIRDTVRQLSRF